MPNHLANESSLYLRQHAENPVNWYPWGDAAWAAAREADKPVIVSIGYSACHWCHVMEHESFEDPYIAGLMNDHYICIKVDREERPDVDQIYMEAVQMLNGHGGWPLHAFCLPDGRPFFGGTYFPPEDRGQGIIPWPQLLMRISDYYKRSRGELEENADNIVKNLIFSNAPNSATGEALQPAELLQAATGILSHYDAEWGGFGQAPKFPPSMTLDFLMSISTTQAVEGQPALARQINQAVVHTLDAMAHGGIFDQIGGGFARYSVDRHWLIPHFEKMLYDNALLLDAYAKGYQRTRSPLYRAVLEETVAWLQREMQVPEGGFAAAIDADSEGVEGKYYVWTPDELREILGEADANIFADTYGITEKGNFEHGLSNPALVYKNPEKRAALETQRKTLLAARARRTPPGKDGKRLLSWNALLVRGLVSAAFALEHQDWLQLAMETVDWLWENLRDGEGRLFTVYYEDGPRHPAYLDDYAHLIEALLAVAAKIDLLHPGKSATYIQQAEELMAVVNQRFRDEHAVGYFFVADDHEALVARKKDWFDNARPCGNSSLTRAFGQLYALTGKADYATEMTEMTKAYPGIAEKAPSAIAHALAGLTEALKGIVVVKANGAADLVELATLLAAQPARECFLLRVEDAAQPEGFQLCVGNQCLEAQSHAARIAEMI